MAGEQPLSIMIKPPVAIAHAIDRLRHRYGVDRRYGCERLHITVLPLRDGRAIPSGFLDLLDKAVSSLDAEPLAITLDRLHRNAFVGARMRASLALQRRLVHRLTGKGLSLPAYRFHPHLSLAYGAAPERIAAIPEIAWLADELLLIRSIYGEGRHELLGRWPLRSRQRCFAFA